MHTRHLDPLARLLSGLPVTELRLQLAGVSTTLIEGGDGPPLVLLHGPGEHAAKWRRVIPGLVRRGHRVIAPDLPGHGRSEDLSDSARVLDWLDELIERTCSAPPALVGQILGGAIAARFAIERPDRIRCLVLCDALGLAPFQPAPEFGQALAGFLERPDEDTHDALWRRCAFDLEALRREMGDDWEALRAYNLDRARARGGAEAQRRLMERFGFPPIPEADLASIAVPTTLIWGRHDLATPLAVAEEAGARLGWPLRVIDDAADDPAIEQPEAFLRALEAAVAPPQRQEREAWDRIAGGYDALVTPSHLDVASEGLRRVGLAPGMRFLDVACGSGALSIPAARLGAQVTAVDLSPAMLDLLVARARSEGLAVEARVMDGHALELEDGSFDVAGSQWGIMLFPRFSQGLRELVRVTRPGGRVLLHVFGSLREAEFLTFFAAALKSVVPGFAGIPTDPPPLPFQMSDPERLRQEMVGAGLSRVDIETTTGSFTFASGRAFWDVLMSSNPIPGQMVSGLDGEQKTRVIEALERAVRERAAGRETARLTYAMHRAIGTKEPGAR